MSGLDAAERATALADRSNLGRLMATGPDLLGLLHRLSTGDVQSLLPGEGRPTVLTSAKGRIVDRLSVHHFGAEGVLLVAGPEGAAGVLAHLARYTFAESTGLSDITASTFAFALFGPSWEASAAAAGIPMLSPYGASSCALAGVRVLVARTNGFDDQGLLVIGPRGSDEPVLAALSQAAASQGGAKVGPEALESWRILKGLPAHGHELTEDHNPLEAGLRDAISFTKGCYVGQEVVARLNTYAKVSRRLVRLELSPGVPVPELGAAVVLRGAVVGRVTSAIRPPGRAAPVALAYVKSREIGDATSVAVDLGGVPHDATIVRL